MSILEPAINSRWHRARGAVDVHITPRDVAVFQLLLKYRFLRKNFIHAFIGGNSFAVQTRLGRLYHTGYLNRPEQQRQYFNANYRPMIYELDDKARAFVGGESAPQQNLLFSHNVMLCDVLANLELGARAHGAELILRTDQVRFPCSISDTLNGKVHYSKTPVTPDALFSIRYPDGKTLHFALEVDCGTEPLKRANLEQTSYWRKLLQYKEVIRTGAYKEFGIPQLFVLHVTNTPARMEHIMELTGASKSNCFRYLPCLGDFAPDPKPDPSFFGPWKRVANPDFDFTK